MEHLIKISAESSIKNIYQKKGLLGGIAEKAIRNYQSKGGNVKSTSYDLETKYSLHFFSVGHVMKQVPKQSILKNNVNSDFEILKKDHFSFFGDLLSTKNISKNPKDQGDLLLNLLENIRNINAHYVHTLDFLNINYLNKSLIEFIIKSFEFACIQTLYNEMKKEVEQTKLLNGESFMLTIVEKNSIYEKIRENNGDNEIFKNFILETFYKSLFETEPANDYGKDLKNYLIKLDKEALINHILIVEFKDDFSWKINPRGNGDLNNHIHEALIISKGRYLSFETALFVLTMFMYKNEATKLIPKVSGFKDNDGNKAKRKITLFSLYAKKFNAQDYDGESFQLVQFRDIIQYLNKIPLTWNDHLIFDNQSTQSIALQDYLLKKEIEKKYEKWTFERASFIDYAIKYFKGEHQPVIPLYEDAIKLNPVFISMYNAILENKYQHYRSHTLEHYTITHIMNVHKKHIKNVLKKSDKFFGDFPKYENESFQNELTTSKKHYLIQSKIKNNLLYKTFLRNTDKFLEYGIRFLLDIGYFGDDACIKCYEHYYMKDQADAIVLLTTKQKDELEYHRGKLTHYISYQEHKKAHPQWQYPFVIENNGLLIRLHNEGQIIAINKDALRYFINHALQNDGQNVTIGKEMMTKYMSAKIAEQKDIFDGNFEKCTFNSAAKILPKRLLNNYMNNENKVGKNDDMLKTLLKDTQSKEERYEALLKLAKQSGEEEQFLERNKGKNFKLRFISRALNLMFFRAKYKEQNPNLDDHHKRFHITRDEFNDFSRYIHAIEHHKDKLIALLSEKTFLPDQTLRQLIEQSQDSESLYNNTKKCYVQWLEANDKKGWKEGNYRKENYINKKNVNLLTDGLFMINISHFKAYLKNTQYANALDFKQDALQKLIPEYYIKPDKNTPSIKKLANALSYDRYMDSLLFQIAEYYYNKGSKVALSKASGTVENILSLTLRQKVGTIQHYDLWLPFKNIERHLEVEKYDNEMFYDKLYTYINNLKINIKKGNQKKPKGKSINETLKKNLLNDGYVSFDNIPDIINNVITDALSYSTLCMQLEEFLIWKHKTTLQIGENRIVIAEIKDFDTIIRSRTYRNNAFHFNLPVRANKDNKTKSITLHYEDYKDGISIMERNFIQINNLSCTDVVHLPNMYKSFYNTVINTKYSTLFKNAVHNLVAKGLSEEEISKEKRAEVFNLYIKSKGKI